MLKCLYREGEVFEAWERISRFLQRCSEGAIPISIDGSTERVGTYSVVEATCGWNPCVVPRGYLAQREALKLSKESLLSLVFPCLLLREFA